jgi:hypothetical protein
MYKTGRCFLFSVVLIVMVAEFFGIKILILYSEQALIFFGKNMNSPQG